MPTDMPKCETCRHWEDYWPEGGAVEYARFRHLRRCAWVDDQDLQDRPKVVLFIDAGDASDFLTAPDFGCIAHQPKEG